MREAILHLIREQGEVRNGRVVVKAGPDTEALVARLPSYLVERVNSQGIVLRLQGLKRLGIRLRDLRLQSGE